MVCENCGSQEAVIHLTQIVDDEMTTVHLCKECAAEKGLETEDPEVNVPLTDFLAQMGEKSAGTPDAEEGRCHFCGLTLEEFKETGRLGCPHCYATFEGHLRNLFRRIHGSTQHVGKVYLPPDPKEIDRDDRLSALRRKLDRAVDSEDFERAADLRDKIQALEGS